MKTARILPLSNPIFILSKDLAEQLPKRIIELRKAAGLTQVVVAERGFRRFPASILPKLAEALGCSEAELIGTSAAKPKKRGPASRLEQLDEKIGKLPRNKQEVIIEMLESWLGKAS